MTEIERFNKALLAATDRLELEGHSDCSNELFITSNAILTTIESQKAEIDKLNMFREDYRKTALQRIAYQESQIESLKAITELAVKGLEEIMSMNYVSGKPSPEQNIAIHTHTQIRKVFNAQT
jgi:uncharacterized membrane protein YjjP (DUF1212 family)